MAIKKTETFVEQVVEVIKERIDAGVYAPGQRIPSENELSAELQVSRATTRSAYIKLSTEGIIKRIHGDGTYVRERIPDLISAQGGVWDFNKLIEHQGYQSSMKGLRINLIFPSVRQIKTISIQDFISHFFLTMHCTTGRLMNNFQHIWMVFHVYF